MVQIINCDTTLFVHKCARTTSHLEGIPLIINLLPLAFQKPNESIRPVFFLAKQSIQHSREGNYVCETLAADVAQLVERSLLTPEIQGLNPDFSKISSTHCTIGKKPGMALLLKMSGISLPKGLLPERSIWLAWQGPPQFESCNSPCFCDPRAAQRGCTRWSRWCPSGQTTCNGNTKT